MSITVSTDTYATIDDNAFADGRSITANLLQNMAANQYYLMARSPRPVIAACYGFADGGTTDELSYSTLLDSQDWVTLATYNPQISLNQPQLRVKWYWSWTTNQVTWPGFVWRVRSLKNPAGIEIPVPTAATSFTEGWHGTHTVNDYLDVFEGQEEEIVLEVRSTDAGILTKAAPGNKQTSTVTLVSFCAYELQRTEL